jgi:hypothetical protein
MQSMPIYKKWGHFLNLMILLISPQFDRAMAVIAATALRGLFLFHLVDFTENRFITSFPKVIASHFLIAPRSSTG